MPIHALLVLPLHLELGSSGHVVSTIDYARVVAATPTLTARINAHLAETAGALGGLERAHQAAHDAAYSDETTCDVGIATDAFVSWVCTRRGAGGPNTGGGFKTVTTEAFFIDGEQLRPATAATIFAPAPDLAGKLGALQGATPDGAPCHVAPDATELDMEPAGVQFSTSDGYDRCVLDWPALAPLLVHDSPSARLSADPPEAPRPRPSAGWPAAPPRFTLVGDAVSDAATGLEWAARDNGADLPWSAAVAYAAAYRSGGHADWRLPTEAELEQLVEPETAHREKGDCTGGKLDVALTPLVHLTCGLAWTATALDPTRAVAVGFVSGLSRVARKADKKNTRALVVRDGKRAAKP